MKLVDFCYPMKYSLMNFMKNIYFEIEKEISEEFSMNVWQVIQIVVDDLKKFVEIMQRQKRAAGGGAAKPARKLIQPGDESMPLSDGE